MHKLLEYKIKRLFVVEKTGQISIIANLFSLSLILVTGDE
jgi:hypothetical protein